VLTLPAAFRSLLSSPPSFFSLLLPPPFSSFFFFNDTATTEIYTLSLHDALPILLVEAAAESFHAGKSDALELKRLVLVENRDFRSEEHTSELQSRGHLVCRLLLEKKKKKRQRTALELK